jgi:hypothetical protein
MTETSAATSPLAQRAVNRSGPLDNQPLRVVVMGQVQLAELAQYLGVPVRVAAELDERSRGEMRPAYALASLASLDAAIRERALRTLIFPHDMRLVISDVEPLDGHIMSDRPFALRVRFAASPRHPPRLLSVLVEWAGESFTVERLIDRSDGQADHVDIRFDDDQSLPTGFATFHVSLFNDAGHHAQFQVTCAILPSNPFSLDLGPDRNFVTGSWSARAVRSGDAYDTGIAVTLSNGDGAAVAMQPGFTWKFWDGGVGGTLVEQGRGDFGAIAVPAFGIWRGWIAFNSPPGSGIFGRYDDREDMSVEIIMTRANGAAVSGTITARTMFRFGVNVTAVAAEDFTDQEWADLALAADVTRTIYERVDITMGWEFRFIERARVGSYEMITSYGQFHNLLSDWSGPNTNNNIDAFIVQGINIDNSGVDGIDGTIPGPTSHDGSNSGIIAAKSGYVDGGVRRLQSTYLGMLIGHELGHYLGLPHIDSAGNLMLWNSGATDTTLTYDQYRIMIDHGWVSIS